LLYLNFHDHIILVRCNESSVLEKLREEFHFFISGPLPLVHTQLSILIEAPPEIPSLVAVKILESCAVYRLGQRQYVDYFGEALIIWDKSENNVTVHGLSKDRAFELSFLVIHSLLGQKLEHSGLCRLHAVAVSINDLNAVIMLPSKGGKSTLLAHLLENPEVKIISDDMPLCDRLGRIYAFPSKISLDEKPLSGFLAGLNWHEFVRHNHPRKWTASLAQLKTRLSDHCENNRSILISGYRLSKGPSILTEVSKWRMLGPMLEHMIIGVGLPQVIELFLSFKFSDIFKMAYHFSQRSICAFGLIRRSRCYHFYLGPDKAYNSQLLMDLMYEHQSS
jgi:hypothetical protein